jgi:hypothetical protein
VEAAKLLNVGKDAVLHGRRVLAEGTPEEIAAVDGGTASVGPSRCTRPWPRASDFLSASEQADRLPLRQQLVNSVTGQIVQPDDKARGYQVGERVTGRLSETEVRTTDYIHVIGRAPASA